MQPSICCDKIELLTTIYLRNNTPDGALAANLDCISIYGHQIQPYLMQRVSDGHARYQNHAVIIATRCRYHSRLTKDSG